MGFKVTLRADSMNSLGQRLTTFELTYPRCIHSEFMTHRVISRNSASSRAIPIHKMLEAVEKDPFIPRHWGRNQSGMQAEDVLSPDVGRLCEALWLEQRDRAVIQVKKLDELKLHKQIANRLLEPWMWITVIATASNWSNFFHLRCHQDAEPHIQHLAYMMRDVYKASVPKRLLEHEFHLPLTGFDQDEDLDIRDKVKVSVGRCARVSYLTHDGKRDVDADIALHDRLKESGHWSPFEHVAQAKTMVSGGKNGNFDTGWLQYRKTFDGECK
jgi:thymidylate synthase ThyX